MSRLKIIACGSVERIEDNILEDMQVQVLDTVTKERYNILCHLVGEPDDGDTYEINVCKTSNVDDVIDTCRMDSTGGVFMDEDFACDVIDDELGFEITQLFMDYFIVPF